MEALDLLIKGFEIALTPLNLLLVILGGFFGTIIGMLPGIGPVNAIAILFPIVYVLGLPPESALILFAGIFYGSQYGNSISSILLNVPGTSASAVTAIDGNALAKKGKGGKALAISAIASFIGGTLSIFLLIFFAPALAEIAIDFGPAEYSVLMVFAFLALATFGGTGIAKSLISAFLGLVIASIGIDPLTGTTRLTFENQHLYDGIDFIVVVIGFFAISELLDMLYSSDVSKKTTQKINKVMISLKEFKNSIYSIFRSCISGFLVGVLPGAGATIASFLAYSSEKNILKVNKFGQGDLRGVAAPESANNASAVGSFIPLLILGVPGSETTAVMLGGLTSLGVTPGPTLLENNAEIFWGLAASMFIGNLFLIFLNLPLVRVFVTILHTPKWILMPLIALLSVIGVYTTSGSSFDIVLMIVFGVIGWIMRRTGFPLAPLILGVVLGGLIETNFRRALIYSEGQFDIFFSSNVTQILWLISIGVIVLPWLKKKFFS